ncbi:MAG: Cache 3/Cache 2 fusion domain-containing protein [Alphaproteobacteria bacterium]
MSNKNGVAMLYTIQRSGFAKKIILSFSLSMFVLGIVLIFKTETNIKTEMVNIAQNNQKVLLNVLKTLLAEKGKDIRLIDNVLFFGDYVINNNYEVPDKVKDIAGGVATIFIKKVINDQIEFERIATNIVTKDGKRAIGTFLDRGDVYDKIIKGEAYIGEADILNNLYYTAYEPIKNEQGDIVGIYFVGLQKDKFLASIKPIIEGHFTVSFFITIFMVLVLALISQKQLKALLNLHNAMNLIIAEKLDIEIPSTDRLDEIGDMARAVEIFRENTIKKNLLEEEQKKAYECTLKLLEQEIVAREKQQNFVSMVSHEFKTPLSIIDSSAQKIIRKIDTIENSEITERMERVRQNVGRLNNLVESTLSLSKLDAGNLTINPSINDLKEVILTTIKEVRNYTPERTIKFEYQGNTICKFDPERVSLVVDNLLSNAIKYSAAEINVLCFEDKDYIKVSVTDTGVGISEEYISRVGEKFFRVDETKNIPGTGVGIYLAKNIIEKHQGYIKIESEKGVGTTIIVSIPKNFKQNVNLDQEIINA